MGTKKIAHKEKIGRKLYFLGIILKLKVHRVVTLSPHSLSDGKQRVMSHYAKSGRGQKGVQQLKTAEFAKRRRGRKGRERVCHKK